jgi:ABC-type hemin transport system substrate-binding protein
MQARLAAALHRPTDLPLKDCQAFLGEDEWDMRRAVARTQAGRKKRILFLDDRNVLGGR